MAGSPLICTAQSARRSQAGYPITVRRDTCDRRRRPDPGLLVRIPRCDLIQVGREAPLFSEPTARSNVRVRRDYLAPGRKTLSGSTVSDFAAVLRRSKLACSSECLTLQSHETLDKDSWSAALNACNNRSAVSSIRYVSSCRKLTALFTHTCSGSRASSLVYALGPAPKRSRHASCHVLCMPLSKKVPSRRLAFEGSGRATAPTSFNHRRHTGLATRL